jgi:hypothetical protein
VAALSLTWGLTWDGVTVEYLPLAPHSASISPGVVVSLVIAHQPSDLPTIDSHLRLIIDPRAVSANMEEQIRSVIYPLAYSQKVSDPSILHLLQLIQAEMQAPQTMNQMFVSSIITVLTMHLLQNFRQSGWGFDKNLASP